MPSVADVISYADYLKVGAIGVDQDRCVAVRNRNATCRACERSCLAAAITIQNNEITLDPFACVNCGVCTTVCPTAALRPLDPAREGLLSQVRRSARWEQGMAVIACARAAAKHIADPERICEVPCLGHVEEHGLAEMAAWGLDDIILVDGDCATCKYGAADPFITTSVQCAADLLEAAGAEAIITRTSSFPDEVISTGHRNIRGEDRRGLLAQTGRYVGRVAGNVAQKMIEEKLGEGNAPKTLKDRLGAGLSGRMPTFEPQENYQLLDSLERASLEADRLFASQAVADTRRFGRVTVDLEPCSGCGLCVLFCPTGALSRSSIPSEDDETKNLEFAASMCVQCRLCEDVCMRRCLHISSQVSMASLFDFEPELIKIARPQKHASLFGTKR